MYWKRQLSEHGQSSLPSCPATALRQASSMFPNIRALASILCTLPVTSCTAERSFSSLKRTKMPFRSSMTTQQLIGLTLPSVHHDISLNIEEAIDEFSSRHPQRLRMVNNMLEDWTEQIHLLAILNTECHVCKIKNNKNLLLMNIN